jgi:uncharacterized protein (TIGR02444 family)
MQNETRDNPFWRYSLRLYREPGIADICLQLQERSGVDVNVLLFVLWLAQEGRATGERDFHAIEEATARWRDETIRPLRAVRSRLKRPEILADTERSALRDAVKTIELQAERIEQRDLYRLSLEPALFPRVPDRDAAAIAADNLAAYETLLDANFGGESRQALLRAWTRSVPA